MTTTDRPADFIRIDASTGYGFHIGQHVYTQASHSGAPLSRNTVTKVTATQVELEEERTGERVRYMVQSRTRRGSQSMWPSQIVGIAREEGQPEYQVGQTVYSHLYADSARRPEVVTAVTPTVITTEYVEAAGQWSGQTRRAHYLVSSGMDFRERFSSEDDRRMARRLDAEYAASTARQLAVEAASVPVPSIPELTPLPSQSTASETEAEDLAAFIRRTGSPAPAETDYPVGVQLASMMELAYLAHGTVLVATKGVHEGTSYRVHWAEDGPKLTSTNRTGRSQVHDLATVVEADYGVEHQNLTIVWTPSDI